MIWTRVTWGHKCVYSSCNKKPQKDPTGVLKIAASFSALQHASCFDSFFFFFFFSLLCFFSCLPLWERIHFKSEWKWTMWQPRLFRVASEDYHIVKLILALRLFGMHRPPPPCQSCHCQRESRVALSGGRGSSAKGAVYESGTDSQRSSCKIPVNRQMIALLPLQVIRPWSSPFVSRLWFPLLIAHL